MKKPDINGCDTLKPGEERCEWFTVKGKDGDTQYVKYCYRNEKGCLFIAIDTSVEEARAQRDKAAASKNGLWI